MHDLIDEVKSILFHQHSIYSVSVPIFVTTNVQSQANNRYAASRDCMVLGFISTVMVVLCHLFGT